MLSGWMPNPTCMERVNFLRCQEGPNNVCQSALLKVSSALFVLLPVQKGL